ncbi:Trypacidin cluster transcription factor [Paramyrothecium foliicola]|nr:Trypacidin cluster transcription factor [Paramyrothecium foliicola]
MQRQASVQTMTPPSDATLSSVERDPTPEFPLLDSQFGVLDQNMLSTSLDDYLTMLPADPLCSTALNFSTSTLSSSDTSTDNRGSSRGSYIADTVEQSATTQADLRFPSHELSMCGHEQGSHTATDTDMGGSTACSLSTDQLLQGFSHFQSQSNSPQPEGINMALQLMGQLCGREDSPSCSNFSGLEAESRPDTLIDECKKVTQTVNGMLQCTGSQDGYFLVVICLVVSKLLNTYGAAAQALSARSNDVQSQMGVSSTVAPLSLSSWAGVPGEPVLGASPPTKGGDPKAAQQLLDGLYQLRSSVDELGAKMQLCLKRDWFLGHEFAASGHDHAQPAVPFSATILNQLYEDLRKRLSSISLDLLNELKHFWTG